MMVKKPTIAELEDMMDTGKYVEITPSGEVNVNPVEHVLEDVLRISDLEKDNMQLREALEKVRSLTASTNFHPVCMKVNKIAGEALAQSPNVK